MDITQIIILVLIAGFAVVYFLLRRSGNASATPTNLPAVSEDVNLPVATPPSTNESRTK